jgi:hypothetical protein
MRSRSINAQAEHWMRIGMLAEIYPDLDHRDICQLLIRAEQAGASIWQPCRLSVQPGRAGAAVRGVQ